MAKSSPRRSKASRPRWPAFLSDGVFLRRAAIVVLALGLSVVVLFLGAMGLLLIVAVVSGGAAELSSVYRGPGSRLDPGVRGCSVAETGVHVLTVHAALRKHAGCTHQAQRH